MLQSTPWGPVNIIIAAGAVVAALLVLRHVHPFRWARRVIHTLSALLQAADELPDVLGTLRGIAEEFHPNHGSSLRDVVDRIERTSNEAKTTSAAAMGMGEATAAKVHGIAERLDGHIEGMEPIRQAFLIEHEEAE